MSDIRIDQKINQNTISMAVGAIFVVLEQYFMLPDSIYYVGCTIMIASAISVVVGLIPYSINYWYKKMNEIKRHNNA